MRDASEIKTRKMYEENAYATEFDAVVVSACGSDIVLDQTLFFPEEGGQCPDRGILTPADQENTSFSVTDVQIRDGEIHHIVSGADAFAKGDAVHGRIDWEFRFSNMQQHSGEHLFSGIVHRRYGFDNVGFHLSEKEVTVDFNGTIPEEDLPSLTEEVARAIYADLPSRVYMTSPEERETMVYRSKLPLPGTVRIVEYPGIDACACCAPHVKHTGEIGILFVTGMIRWKGGVRVNILCGARALRFIMEEHRILSGTARYLTTAPQEVYGQVVRMKEETRALSAALHSAKEELLLAEVSKMGDGDDAILFADGIDAQTARSAVNAMTASREGICAVFFGTEADGYSFVIGSAYADVREISKALREKLAARGGGKPEMVQGFVKASEEEIRTVCGRVPKV